MAGGNIGMTNMAIILDEALKSGGGKYTFEAVGNLIMQNGFTKSFEIVSKLVQDLMDAKETTDPKEEEKNQEKRNIPGRIIGKSKETGTEITFLPITRWFGIGVGILHIQPSEFWRMTLPQLNIAIELHNEFHGGSKVKPLTKDEMEDLMTRFPD